MLLEFAVFPGSMEPLHILLSGLPKWKDGFQSLHFLRWWTTSLSSVE